MPVTPDTPCVHRAFLEAHETSCILCIVANGSNHFTFSLSLPDLHSLIRCELPHPDSQVLHMVDFGVDSCYCWQSYVFPQCSLQFNSFAFRQFLFTLWIDSWLQSSRVKTTSCKCYQTHKIWENLPHEILCCTVCMYQLIPVTFNGTLLKLIWK